MRASFANHYRRMIPQLLELSVLSLHLLQICLVYVNTLMIQSVLAQEHWKKRLTARDLQAITPLIFAHVNPYGLFRLGGLSSN
ncbi:MAG: transposase [Pleurocapsa sp. CRU_1_2]|nr:transposase [Pleurocapsa sp. CRU_1_2]